MAYLHKLVGIGLELIEATLSSLSDLPSLETFHRMYMCPPLKYIISYVSSLETYDHICVVELLFATKKCPPVILNTSLIYEKNTHVKK